MTPWSAGTLTCLGLLVVCFLATWALDDLSGACLCAVGCCVGGAIAGFLNDEETEGDHD